MPGIEEWEEWRTFENVSFFSEAKGIKMGQQKGKGKPVVSGDNQDEN